MCYFDLQVTLVARDIFYPRNKRYIAFCIKVLAGSNFMYEITKTKLHGLNKNLIKLYRVKM